MNRGTPRQVPFTLDVGAPAGFTDAIQARFERETGASDPAEHFDYDLRTTSLEQRRGETAATGAGELRSAAPAPGGAAPADALPPGTNFVE